MERVSGDGYLKPGGTPLKVDSNCNIYLAQARGGMYWTQNPKYANNARFCYLGGAQTLSPQF